ncbi:MAG TPA: transmembrane anchor protein [Thermoanaerobaculia bacterium]|nr:transmembrane anchor protein [Thermoanaerobaculia bacterium]
MSEINDSAPNISNSVPTNLPSTQRLIRSTLIAMVTAGVLLVAVVLPAEYGVDATGIGNVLGLTEMGKIKTSLAKEAKKEEAAAVSKNPSAESSAALPVAAPEAFTSTNIPPAAATPLSNVVTIVLKPDQGREIKLSMREGARVTYTWSTDRGVVNYDTHADSVSPPRDYHGYQKGTRVNSDKGELVAAFDGWHGWFWRNRGTETVTITLRTTGDYQQIKEPE